MLSRVVTLKIYPLILGIPKCPFRIPFRPTGFSTPRRRISKCLNNSAERVKHVCYHSLNLDVLRFITGENFGLI
jgi:hypothetical protein